MSKRNYLSILALFFFFFSQAQENQEAPTLRFGERIIVGTSLTFIADRPDELSPFYKEFTWNKNIAVNINKSIYVGLSHFNLFTYGNNLSTLEKTKNNYFLFGSFVQYDFMPKKRSRLFLEASWNRGNYCTCELQDPYKRKNLNYIGLGAGFDVPIARLWSLDFGFMSYNILEKVPRKYNYTQYVIGLNFDFTK